MYQVSEVLDLMLAIVLSPIIVFIARRIRTTGTDWAAAGTLCVYLSYVFTVGEGYWAPVLLNVVEHLMLAVAGVCFAVASVQMYKAAKSREDA